MTAIVRKLSITILLVSIAMALGRSTSYSWGFYAHKKINRMAVYTLPEDLLAFYKPHIDFVAEHAVDPDKRRYGSAKEAPRHYIDIDHYSKEDPFGVVPQKWDDAVAKFTEDTLQAYGIVPWHIEKMIGYLTWAFKEEDIDRILRTSADLGHYVADAHVPLHTTENYNGQLTNQKGIHAFWESRLPELEAEGYDYFTGRATYMAAPLEDIWSAIKVSHNALDSVLSFEKELNDSFPSDLKYGFEKRGAKTIRTYSRDYSKAYHEKLDGMVERRMREAILMVGSCWYTAWVNAGKPDLGKISKKQISEELKKEISEEEAEFQKGKIKGRAHDH